MKKSILSIIVSALIAALIFATAFAAGIKFTATFSLGSLIANGTISGIGNTDVTMVLDASGIPVITCVNNGGNRVPGQSSPKVSARGSVLLPGDSTVRKNGKSPYGVETQPPAPLTWQQAGCPNSNWTAQITFVYWTNATISVYNTGAGVLLAKQNYACKTTPTSVSCTPIN